MGSEIDESYSFDCQYKKKNEFLDPEQLSQNFFNIYFINILPKLNEKFPTNIRKKSDSENDQIENKLELVVSPRRYDQEMSLNCIGSAFCVFSYIRYCVLGCSLQNHVSYALNPFNGRNTSENTSEKHSSNIQIGKLSKLFEIGIKQILVIINECKLDNPSLCEKSLKALRNMLAEQNPESMCLESFDLMENLFEILLEIIMIESTNKASNDMNTNNLSSLAYSCLVALVLCWGNCGYILSAIKSMLIYANPTKKLLLPEIAVKYQRSILVSLMERINIPDWYESGLNKNCLTSSNHFDSLPICNHCSISSDGSFLYIYSKSYGIYKVGTGFSNTVEGWIYAFNNKIKAEGSTCWIGAFGEFLLIQPKKDLIELFALCKSTLNVLSKIDLSSVDTNGIFFSDGANVGQIFTTKTGEFAISTFLCDSYCLIPKETTNLKLTLTVRDLYFSGNLFQKENNYTLKPVPIIGESCNSTINEICDVQCGKEFALALTITGQVYFIGKANSIGINYISPSGQTTSWSQVTLPKDMDAIKEISIGNDGLHALIRSSNGIISCIGLTKYGEDGHPPLKKHRVFGKSTSICRVVSGFYPSKIISVYANSGTSAFISDKGEVFVLGKVNLEYVKDRRIPSLSNIFFTHVALGKAHFLLLSNDGVVYSFGYNHKGQCGRAAIRSNVRHESRHKLEDFSNKRGEFHICKENHEVVDGECMICTFCGNCTEYGIYCVLSNNENRLPGSKCGCGTGQSGCKNCGLCKSCILDINQIDVDQKMVSSTKENLQHPLIFHEPFDFNQASPNVEMEYGKSISVPPEPLVLKYKVTNVACGLHHSIILFKTKQIATFGANSYGQLGLGDQIMRDSPIFVRNCNDIISISAGNNHTVILSEDNFVYTTGCNMKGQLCRKTNESKSYSVSFEAVPGIGGANTAHGKKIMARSDSTIIQIEDSFVNKDSLQTCQAFSTNTSICLVSPSLDNQCMFIKKGNGQCNVFRGDSQIGFQDNAICFDPIYDVLYSYKYEKKVLEKFNILLSEGFSDETNIHLLKKAISFENNIAVKAGCFLNVHQVALFLLNSIAILNEKDKLKCFKKTDMKKHRKFSNYKRVIEDYNIQTRFHRFAPMWSYFEGSVEAIQFNMDKNVTIGGFGLYGGRGQYFARMKLIELGKNGGENEGTGEVITTSNLVYECLPYEIYPVLFDEPVHCKANCWYVVVAYITGPSSDSGDEGISEAIVPLDGATCLHIKYATSKRSNNGTTVHRGQIPYVYYKLTPPDILAKDLATKSFKNSIDPISLNFTNLTTDLSAESVIKLLQWSWTTICLKFPEVIKLIDIEFVEAQLELKNCIEISNLCIRILAKYVKNNINKLNNLNDCCRLFKKILAETILKIKWLTIYIEKFPSVNVLLNNLLNQCHSGFVQCFSVFYSGPQKKWNLLCEILSSFDIKQIENNSSNAFLLSATLEALCDRKTSLSTVFPICNSCDTPDNQQSFCKSDSSASHLDTLSLSDHGQLLKSPPDLMSSSLSYSFKDILDKILAIVAYPAGQIVKKETSLLPNCLIQNACFLLEVLMSDLVVTTNLNTSQEQYLPKNLTNTFSLLTTPSRFSRTSVASYWSTGNGNAEAICFSVSESSYVISIAGACVYGSAPSNSGAPQHFEYELELLENIDCTTSADKWQLISYTSGSFTNDDCINDTYHIKFDKIVSIKEQYKYAIRFRNRGPRTFHGDQGLGKVQGSDGTTFTFTNCSLSTNGTNHIRGQIPQILYYISDKQSQLLKSNSIIKESCKRNALQISATVISIARSLLLKTLNNVTQTDFEYAFKKLGSIEYFNSLMPTILGHIGTMALIDVRNTCSLLNTMKQFLPILIDFNKQYLRKINSYDENKIIEYKKCDSQGKIFKSIVVVESSHPYKPASVNHYNVNFNKCVKWLSIEFDKDCSIGFTDDVLQIFIPSKQEYSQPFQLFKFSTKTGFPKIPLIVPGNELMFCLNSVTANSKNINKKNYYGFRCLITGYDYVKNNGLIELEKECCYLTSLCASSFLSPKVCFNENYNKTSENFEERVNVCFLKHNKLLASGLSIGKLPTIRQAIDNILPISSPSNEQQFLNDFLFCVPCTCGGRLANWLQSERRIEPSKCSIIVMGYLLRACVPITLKVLTNDQYGNRVVKHGMDVEIQVVNSNLLTRLYTSSTISPHITFKPVSSSTTKNVIYQSISMMKEYQNYSFEELRFFELVRSKSKFKTAIKAKSIVEGLYTCEWVPPNSGFYDLKLNIDGKESGHVLRLHVDEPFHTPSSNKANKLTKSNSCDKKCNIRSRVFTAKYSNGLRVRSQPSLQSEQIGIIKCNSIVYYFNEVCNNDGVWLRLASKSIKEFCPQTKDISNDLLPDAWVMQYHAHLEKTFLVALKSIASDKENHRQLKLSKKSLLKIEPSRAAQSIAIAYPDDNSLFLLEEKEINDNEIWGKVKFTKINPNENSPSRKCEINHGWILLRDKNKIFHQIESIDDELHENFDCDITSPINSFVKTNNDPSSQFKEKHDYGNVSSASFIPPKTPKKTFADSRKRSVLQEPKNVLTPSIAECVRTVFAAILFHEGITYDAMASATYLKFHPKLSKEDVYDQPLAEDIEQRNEYPITLNLIVKLWEKISHYLYNLIKQNVNSITITSLGQSPSSNGDCNSERINCELCINVSVSKDTFMEHLLKIHPGCHDPASQRDCFAFNESGTYCDNTHSGFRIRCGDIISRGVLESQRSYKLCYNCHTKYLWAKSKQLQSKQQPTTTFVTENVAYSNNHKYLNAHTFEETNMTYQEKIRKKACFLLQLNPVYSNKSSNLSSITDELDLTNFPSVLNIDTERKNLSRSSSIDTFNKSEVSEKRMNNSTDDDYIANNKIMIQKPSSSLLKVFMECESHIDKQIVIDFVKTKDELEFLESVCKDSIRKSVLRIYGLKTLNWIFRSTTQLSCLHDSLWGFVSALYSNHSLENPDKNIQMAGYSSNYCLSEALKIFLQDVAESIPILPENSISKLMAIRCFDMDFRRQCHPFLHRCKILNKIDTIISNECRLQLQNDVYFPEQLVDLKPTNVVASSRQVMIGSLTDNNTDTFWESGDEEKSKASKSITIFTEDKINRILLYINNKADHHFRISKIIYHANIGVGNVKEIYSTDIDSKFSGWHMTIISPKYISIKIELKGESTLRLHQIKLLGVKKENIINETTSRFLLRTLIETDSIKIFNRLSRQLLLKLFTENENKDCDLKITERVSKLSQLQLEVCDHLIRCLLNESHKQFVNNEYCLQMLLTLLELCNWVIGRNHLAKQTKFINNLSILLHSSDDNLQRCTLSLYQQLFMVIDPKSFAAIINIRSLPDNDYTTLLTKNIEKEALLNETPKLLDCFLSIIAKSLKLQYRCRENGRRTATRSVIFSDCITDNHHNSGESVCWFKSSNSCETSLKIATEIIDFLENICNGQIDEQWSKTLKACLAQSVLVLATIDMESSKEKCLENCKFWLAIAALAVLQDEHGEKLTSSNANDDGNSKKTTTFCDNHDDSTTLAILTCNYCGNLCAECNRFLHLNKRRTKHHRFDVFRQERESIKIDIQEGCRRMKLFWLSASVVTSKRDAIVEFLNPIDNFTNACNQCRYCTEPTNNDIVCDNESCQEYFRESCLKKLDCGHACCGVANETMCPPCLYGCVENLKQDKDDMCMICFTETLPAAPILLLGCGHMFHYNCCKNVLSRRWNGPRITFGFSMCPICKQDIKHSMLNEFLVPIRSLYKDVLKKATMRYKYENNPKDDMPDEKDFIEIAMNRYAYYECAKCKKAYYGGDARCDMEMFRNDDNYDKNELVCGSCSNVSGAELCPKHGSDFLEYKCRYCCSIAAFFCFGTTHFCNLCHDDFKRLTMIKQDELPPCPVGPMAKPLTGTDECPLKVTHPPTGEEFAMGCGMCKNLNTF